VTLGRAAVFEATASTSVVQIRVVGVWSAEAKIGSNRRSMLLTRSAIVRQRSASRRSAVTPAPKGRKGLKPHPGNPSPRKGAGGRPSMPPGWQSPALGGGALGGRPSGGDRS